MKHYPQVFVLKGNGSVNRDITLKDTDIKNEAESENGQKDWIERRKEWTDFFLDNDEVLNW